MQNVDIACSLSPVTQGTTAAMPERVPDRQQRFRSLFDEHSDFVWRTLRRFGVPDSILDDLGQEVFLVAARRLDELVPGRERSFLFGTTRRVAAQARRKRAETPAASDDPVWDLPAQGDDPERALDDRQALAALDSILDSLEEPIREVFVLFELEGLSKAEVAELLGIPEGTAASRLRKARTQFSSLAARVSQPRSSKGGTP